ncbi:hypothetical protein [Paracoccus hibiscisoli]|uniref:hypothetical protein n=1 Tax=Paracoccus hibiscisoli TaxID=2023261 RepID=UPI00145C58BD|nr:hypothetical protein [Paracoccus hibiscisoli]
MTTDPKDHPTPSDKDQPDRRNKQGEHHGVPHSPEEFDTQNPAKLKRDPDDKA